MFMINQKNPFELLCTKDIIAILDGDTDFGDYELDDERIIKLHLPYRSGPDLCSISTQFGNPVTYNMNGVNLSRWKYVDDLIKYCIKQNRSSDLLKYLFDKTHFSKMLSGCCAEEIDKVHELIVKNAMEKINSILYFGGHELKLQNNEYVIIPVGVKMEVETPSIKIIDRNYIKSISERALQDVEQGNYDSAITKSRTLLEETFCYVIEKKNEIPNTSGKIETLYKQVKTLYNMHGDASTDRRINTLLSGLEKIISSISEMRNKDSDSHGVGANRINIDEHHARLFVNASLAMSDFILSVQKKSIGS